MDPEQQDNVSVDVHLGDCTDIYWDSETERDDDGVSDSETEEDDDGVSDGETEEDDDGVSDCESVDDDDVDADNANAGDSDNVHRQGDADMGEDCVLEEGEADLEFGTYDEAYKFYSDYAHKVGFSIRKKYGSPTLRRSIKFLCSKEGVRNPVETVDRQRKRAETRQSCTAGMVLHLNRSKEGYKIFSWRKEHNHPLHCKRNAHFMRSNRKVTEVLGIVARMNKDAGATLRSTYEVMCDASGGCENVGFLQIDLKNHLTAKREKKMELGDASAMYEYFDDRKARDPGFFSAVELDVDEKVANIFWADSQMIADYGCFGDAITFDTTFRTNNNYRPLGIFVGLNNHRQICIFGAALLYDETKASFAWLFESFMRCMNYKAPLTIFTDQCAAIAAGLKAAMPGAFHALCTWHLLENAKKAMGGKLVWESELRTMMYSVTTEHEFNVAWQNMLSKSFPGVALRDSHWLARSLKIKKKWAAPWVKENFTGGMCSTQLSESINAVCRGYLKPDHNIVEFFLHFDRVVRSRREAEKLKDFRAVDTLPLNLFPHSPIMTSAAEHYTPTMLGRFQEEYQKALSYVAEIRPETVNLDILGFCCYTIEEATGLPIDVRSVHVRVENVLLSCSCRMFETAGILCRHIVTVMELLRVGGNRQMRSLPPHYILRRWTKYAKEGLEIQEISTQRGQYIEGQRYQNICALSTPIAKIASVESELYEIAQTKMLELKKYLEDLQLERAGGQEPSVTETAAGATADTNGASTSSPRRGTTFKVRPPVTKNRKMMKSISERERQKSFRKIQRQSNPPDPIIEQFYEQGNPPGLTW